jgi:catechol 2,3-dioxygenase
MSSDSPAPAGDEPRGLGIGHLHLEVADLGRATAFYRDVLGFRVVDAGPERGERQFVRLTSGDYHHRLVLTRAVTAGGGSLRGTSPVRVAFVCADRC